MPTENVTTKYKVDVSDLKKNITEANKTIKLANAEFKNATAGLDDWSKSADGLSAKIKEQNTIVEAEKKKLDALKEQLQRLIESQKTGQKVIDDLTAKHEEAVKIYGAESDEAKTYAKQLEQAEAAQERNAKAADELNLKIINQDTAVKKAAAQVQKFEGQLEELKNAEKKAGDESDDLSDSIGDVDKEAKATTNGGVSAFTVALGNLAANVITALIKKLGDLTKATKEAFLSFDEGRDAVIKATGATGDAADELTKSYAKVAKSVQGDFGDIGSALGEVNTRFEFTGEQLEQATTQFVKFADVTGTDAVTAVQLVSRAMADAGIDSSEYSSVLDYLAKAAQASGISVDKLAENLTKYGAPMRALGFDTKEAIAIFSQWEKAGVNTETAFSGMKTAISKWSAEGKDAKVEFQKALEQIAAAPDIAAATTKSIEIFGKKAGPDLADAIQAGRFEYSDFLSLLEGSEGTVAATYDETQSGADKAALAIQKLKVQAAELVNTFMEKYGPQISAAIDKISAALEKVFPVIESIINWLIKYLPPIAPYILAIVAAIAAYVTYTKLAAAAQWALNAAMAANPTGLIIAGITALVVAFIALWKRSEKFRNFWKKLWAHIQKAVNATVNVIKTAWDKIKKIATKAKTVIAAILNQIVDIFKAAWVAIKAVWSTVKPFFSAIWTAIKTTFSVVSTVLGGFFKAAWEAIKLVWGVAVEFFTLIWNGIKAVFSVVASVLGGFFRAAWNSIKVVWDLVVGYFETIWKSIKAIFSVVGNVLTGNFRDAWNGIKSIWNNVTGYFKSVWNGIKSIFGNVTGFFKRAFTDAWNAVKSVFSGVGEFFGGMWDTIKEQFTAIGSAIGDAVGGAFKSVLNGALSTVEDVINGGIKLINGAIKIINKIPGVDIDKIKEVKFDKLAKGGIVSKPTVAEIGEAGDEAVIPLENNKRGLKRIAALLANELEGGVGSSGNTPGGTVYNFNQTNNSPKALSRWEIYRQTRNLINAAKGV